MSGPFGGPEHDGCSRRIARTRTILNAVRALARVDRRDIFKQTDEEHEDSTYQDSAMGVEGLALGAVEHNLGVRILQRVLPSAQESELDLHLFHLFTQGDDLLVLVDNLLFRLREGSLGNVSACGFLLEAVHANHNRQIVALSLATQFSIAGTGAIVPIERLAL